MNAYDHINQFIATLALSESQRNLKKRYLNQFCRFIEKSQNLDSDNWNFNGVRLLYYGTQAFRLPIDTTILMDYFSNVVNLRSPSVYNNTLTTVKQFFSYLVDQGVLLENHAWDLTPKQLVKRDMSDFSLNHKEAEALLKHSVSVDEHINRNFALVLMLLSTANRIGEIINLTENDLRIESELNYANGKSGARRRWLTPALKEALNKLLEDPHRKEALKDSEKRFIFYSTEGGPLTTKESNKLLKKIANLAGINKNITAYWLRRTYARMLYDSGFSLREIQTIFDHDRIKNTECYVLISQRDDIRNLVEKSPLSIALSELLKEQVRSIR